MGASETKWRRNRYKDQGENGEICPLRPERAGSYGGSVAERHPVDLTWANYVSNRRMSP